VFQLAKHHPQSANGTPVAEVLSDVTKDSGLD
jgi:hypothetical protein